MLAPLMRGHRYLAAAAALALGGACNFDESGVNFAGGDASIGVPDAGKGNPDAAPGPDAGCGGAGLTTPISNIDPCDIPAPTGPLVLNDDGSWVLDTDTGVLTDGTQTVPVASALVAQTSGGEMVRVVSVTSLTVGATSLATYTLFGFRGSHPVVVVSFGDITVDGALFAGASGARAGPGGGNGPVCGNGIGTDGDERTMTDGTGGAGGGGGGYGSKGGKGSNVEGASGGGNPIAGGSTGGNVTLVPLRGGCSGGHGGLLGNPGGGGGGGMQLFAEGTLHVTGLVTARGGGGQPPADQGGGGNDQAASSGGSGGGSGGALLLEAATIEITSTGVIAANGGGGGEGTRTGGASFYGDPGDDGHSIDANPAFGGNSGLSSGGVGGTGAVGSAAAGDAFLGSSLGIPAGGGGGGGGVGRIRFNATTRTIDPGAVVTPDASTN